MKKQLALALGLAVISGSALASKARLEALGESGNGSQYLMDARNIFLNPAQANYFKDMVTFETGSTTNNSDTVAAPNAEGSFLRASGNMVYGAAFGHENSTITTARQASNANHPADMNMWDFFVAGDAGVQWGANLTYGSFKNDQGTNKIASDSIRTRLGVISGDTEAFLMTTISEKAEEKSVSDFKMKSMFNLGVSHNLNGGTIMLSHTSWEATEGENVAKDDAWKFSGTTLGYGKVSKLNDAASFNWKVAYSTSETKNSSYDETNGKVTDTALAATMGIETMVKEWLTLRASVAQNIMSENKTDAGKKTAADSTAVTAGASLVFGDFQIDGMVGNDSTGLAPGATTASGNGTLRTDSLLSRVSATYRF